MAQYVVVDWRPYDVPEVYGTFSCIEDADTFARKVFEIDTDDINLPDGIIVREMVDRLDVWDNQYV